MDIGMTGTRQGMTEQQKRTFTTLLENLQATRLHHGDCIGADTDAHQIASQLDLDIIIHPPVKDEVRAYNEGDEMRKEKGYFARNRDIVIESNAIIGTPVTPFETKGGTWYTINFGIKKGRPVYIVKPDGVVDARNTDTGFPVLTDH